MDVEPDWANTKETPCNLYDLVKLELKVLEECDYSPYVEVVVPMSTVLRFDIVPAEVLNIGDLCEETKVFVQGERSNPIRSAYHAKKYAKMVAHFMHTMDPFKDRLRCFWDEWRHAKEKSIDFLETTMKLSPARAIIVQKLREELMETTNYAAFGPNEKPHPSPERDASPTRN
jgi:hypothetical protein